MKRLFIAAFALLSLAATTASAQDRGQNQRNREEMVKKMTAEQAERITKKLNLDGEKAKAFTDLFIEYRTKEMELRRNASSNANRNRGDRGEGKKKEKMTDAQADSLINARFTLQQKELELKKEYYAKFRTQFSPSQLVEVFASQQRPDFNGQRPNRGGRDGNFPGGQRGNFGGRGMDGGFGGPGIGGGF